MLKNNKTVNYISLKQMKPSVPYENGMKGSKKEKQHNNIYREQRAHSGVFYSQQFPDQIGQKPNQFIKKGSR